MVAVERIISILFLLAFFFIFATVGYLDLQMQLLLLDGTSFHVQAFQHALLGCQNAHCCCTDAVEGLHKILADFE